MNKEELLQKIKDEVARDQGYLGIDHLIELSSDKYILKALDEIASRYAIAMCEEQKRECSENASSILIDECGNVHTYGYDIYSDEGWCRGTVESEVDKQSILNTKNVAE